jgi:hypothetical protein
LRARAGSGVARGKGHGTASSRVSNIARCGPGNHLRPPHASLHPPTSIMPAVHRDPHAVCGGQRHALPQLERHLLPARVQPEGVPARGAQRRRLGARTSCRPPPGPARAQGKRPQQSYRASRPPAVQPHQRQHHLLQSKLGADAHPRPEAEGQVHVRRPRAPPLRRGSLGGRRSPPAGRCARALQRRCQALHQQQLAGRHRPAKRQAAAACPAPTLMKRSGRNSCGCSQ